MHPRRTNYAGGVELAASGMLSRPRDAFCIKIVTTATGKMVCYAIGVNAACIVMTKHLWDISNYKYIAMAITLFIMTTTIHFRLDFLFSIWPPPQFYIDIQNTPRTNTFFNPCHQTATIKNSAADQLPRKIFGVFRLCSYCVRTRGRHSCHGS